MKTLILLSLLISACTKEVRYSKEALLKLAQDADPTVSIIIPKMDEGVQCSEYTPPCFSGHLVNIKNLEMLALEYLSQDEAMQAAKKYRGYYSGNWFFDDVAGEPVLEEFVQKHLDAKKP